MTAYLLRCASASDWSGRGEDRARVGHRLVEEQAVEVVAEVVVRLDVAAAATRSCSAAPGGPGSAAPAAAVATNRRRAPGPRGSGRRRAAAPAGPGSTTGRPCRPRRRRCPRPGASARSPPRSWMCISPTCSDDGSPNTRRRPSGVTTTSRPTRIRFAAASMIRSAARSTSRSPPTSALLRPSARVIGRPPAADGRAMVEERNARAARDAARASGSARSSAAAGAGGAAASAARCGRSAGRAAGRGSC